MRGLIIIAVVIIFGGGLAFLGDRVGMKVGKKRLSIFGLRPKYTSMIITVLTGFFIAGLTLVTLTLISEYARVAIFDLHSIQDKLRATVQKVNTLTSQIVAKQQEYLGLNQKYSVVKEKLKQMENRLQKTQRELVVKQQANQVLEKKNDLLNVDNEKLAVNNQGLVVQNENLTRISDLVKHKNEDLNRERERLNQQLHKLGSELLIVQDRTKGMEEKPLLFYVGEIILSRVIEPGIKSEALRSTVINPLLQAANEIALKQGARIPGKTDYALRIQPSRINEVCGQLAQLKDKAVLRVVAESNSVSNEPVNVTLEVFPDVLLFKSGEKIAETELTAKNSESELRDRLLGLMVLAYNKAIIKGIITDEQSLRDLISVADIVTVINLIKQYPESSFQAALIATQDIYRTSRFQIKIEVSRERGGKKS
jgi:uncharacterized protein (DUF3084 family)